MPSAFVDTNVLVYAAEEVHPLTRKGRIAREILHTPGLALSVQVLNEFIATARNPQKLALESAVERKWLAQFSRLQVTGLSHATVVAALRIHDRHQTSHWDSLILASAAELHCPIVYSEDLSDGQDYDGVRVVNPFK
jgi:predicted nucleic acid-binding protein